jgi:hypothetical protein
MTKHKRPPKPERGTLLLTGEDAINLNLGEPLAFHLPFGCLKHYYGGGIHRPQAKVGSLSSITSVGHEFYPNVGMFHKPGDACAELQDGSWLSEGVFVGANRYDARDVLGAHMQTSEGQEMVFASVESINGNRPFPYAIRNFAKNVKGFLPKVQAEHHVARVHSWREKVDSNLKHMISSWGEPEVASTVIYAGSGPSLRHNCQELLHLDYSKASVWAANQAFGFLMKHGIHVDYFFCMDATAFPEWWSEIDCSETCLVAAPFVNPEILKAKWKKVYWYNIASDGFYFNKVRQAKPHLVEIDAHRGVGSAIIESAWIKKASRVIMAGCDFCYECSPDGTVWRSAGWKLDRDGWKKLAASHAHYLVYNSRGESVPTYLGLAFEAAAIYAAAQCLWEQGVEVVNATEGGILRPNPTARYLAQAVAKKGKPIMREMTLAEAVSLANAER